jgi:predicted nucleic-acid-binding protein
MRLTVDTNVLVRAAVRDEAAQATLAMQAMAHASVLAVSLPCLCEFVWVLSRVYHFDKTACANAVRTLLAASNVATNRPAAEAGLALLDAGGDFADGVIAHEGQWLGGDVFVSFDKHAVALLSEHGEAAQLLT